MNNWLNYVREADSIAIAGHVKPDGDCIGACMSMYHYIKRNWKDKRVQVYLNGFNEVFHYLSDWEKVDMDFNNESYGLFISLDCADLERLGKGRQLFQAAKRTLNIDHHVTNTRFADFNIIKANASATCEILFDLYKRDEMNYDVAVALYTGVIHDTGILKYSSTTKHTMEVVGELIEMGVPFTKIIDESFYQKTYIQNQILGRCLLESVMVMNGKCLFTVVKRKVLDFYNAVPDDLEGVVEQLRITQGVEVAILLYEKDHMEYKVSMRSKDCVDVSKIAAYFGGGGHIRAAGCTMKGSVYDALNNLTEHIERELFKTSGGGKGITVK